MDGYLQAAAWDGDGHAQARQGDVVMYSTGAGSQVLIAGGSGAPAVVMGRDGVGVNGPPPTAASSSVLDVHGRALFTEGVSIAGSVITRGPDGVEVEGFAVDRGVAQVDKVIADKLYRRVGRQRTMQLTAYDAAASIAFFDDATDAGFRFDPFTVIRVTSPATSFFATVTAVDVYGSVTLVGVPVDAFQVGAGYDIAVLEELGVDPEDEVEMAQRCAEEERTRHVYGYVTSEDGVVTFAGPPEGVFSDDVSTLYDRVGGCAYRVIGPRTLEPLVHGARAPVVLRSVGLLISVEILDAPRGSIVPLVVTQELAALVAAGAEAMQLTVDDRAIQLVPAFDGATLGVQLADLNSAFLLAEWGGRQADLMYTIPHPGGIEPRVVTVTTTVDVLMDGDTTVLEIGSQQEWELDLLNDTILTDVRVGSDGATYSVLSNKRVGAVTSRVTLVVPSLSWDNVRVGTQDVTFTYQSLIEQADTDRTAFVLKYWPITAATLPRIERWHAANVVAVEPDSGQGALLQVSGIDSERVMCDVTPRNKAFVRVFYGDGKGFLVDSTHRGPDAHLSVLLSTGQPPPAIGTLDMTVIFSGFPCLLQNSSRSGQYVLGSVTTPSGSESALPPGTTHVYLIAAAAAGHRVFQIVSRFHGLTGEDVVELISVSTDGVDAVADAATSESLMYCVPFRVPGLDAVSSGGPYTLLRQREVAVTEWLPGPPPAGGLGVVTSRPSARAYEGVLVRDGEPATPVPRPAAVHGHLQCTSDADAPLAAWAHVSGYSDSSSLLNISAACFPHLEGGSAFVSPSQISQLSDRAPTSVRRTVLDEQRSAMVVGDATDGSLEFVRSVEGATRVVSLSRVMGAPRLSTRADPAGASGLVAAVACGPLDLEVPVQLALTTLGGTQTVQADPSPLYGSVSLRWPGSSDVVTLALSRDSSVTLTRTVADQSSAAAPTHLTGVASPRPELVPALMGLPDGVFDRVDDTAEGLEFSLASDRKQRVLALPGRVVSAGGDVSLSHALDRVAPEGVEAILVGGRALASPPQTGSSLPGTGALQGWSVVIVVAAPRVLVRGTTRSAVLRVPGVTSYRPQFPALRRSGLLVVDSSGERLVDEPTLFDLQLGQLAETPASAYAVSFPHDIEHSESQVRALPGLEADTDGPNFVLSPLDDGPAATLYLAVVSAGQVHLPRDLPSDCVGVIAGGFVSDVRTGSVLTESRLPDGPTIVVSLAGDPPAIPPIPGVIAMDMVNSDPRLSSLSMTVAEGRSFTNLADGIDLPRYPRVASYQHGHATYFAPGVPLSPGWHDAVAFADHDWLSDVTQSSADTTTVSALVWPLTEKRLRSQNAIAFDTDTGTGSSVAVIDPVVDAFSYAESAQTVARSGATLWLRTTAGSLIPYGGSVPAVVLSAKEAGLRREVTLDAVNRFERLLVGGHALPDEGSALTVDGRADMLGGLRFRGADATFDLSFDHAEGDLHVGRARIDAQGRLATTSLQLPGAWAVRASTDVGATVFEKHGTVLAGVKDVRGETLATVTERHLCHPRQFEADADAVGMVVTCSEDHMSVEAGLHTGLRAITAKESLPVVVLADRDDDEMVFGVVVGFETDRSADVGAFSTPYSKRDGDVRAIVQRKGTGAVWVCDKHGPIQCGDLLTTSTVRGYCGRQADNLLRSCTVSKVTMTCLFDGPTRVRRRPLTRVEQQRVPVLETVEVDGELALTWQGERYVEGPGPTRTVVRPETEIVPVFSPEGGAVRLERVPKVRVSDVVRDVVGADGRTVWEDDVDSSGAVLREPLYAMRWLTQNGREISESEFDSHVAQAQVAYRAALLPCVFL
jgi:hypothetical protein